MQTTKANKNICEYGGADLSNDKLMQEAFMAVRGRRKNGERAILWFDTHGAQVPLIIGQLQGVYFVMKAILHQRGIDIKSPEADEILRRAGQYDMMGKHMDRANFGQRFKISPEGRRKMIRLLSEKKPD